MKTIDRNEWGASHPDGFGARPMPVSEFWLHHSVTIAPDLSPPFNDDDAAVRTLERIGQSRFGGGISYTFPVTPVGRLYEGHSLHRRGAHTKGHNTVGAAFCLVGNYDTLEPTHAQKVAIASKMVELHRGGKATRHTLNGGHRDVFGTACPGRRGYAAIPEINRIAEELWDGQHPSLGGGGGVTAKTYTRDDVRRFQRVHNLDDDGLWGPNTERQAQAIRRTLKPGLKRSKWDLVRYWRLRLSRPKGEQSSREMRKGVQWALKVTSDGDWGPATDAAWLAMRSQHRVTK